MFKRDRAMYSKSYSIFFYPIAIRSFCFAKIQYPDIAALKDSIISQHKIIFSLSTLVSFRTVLRGSLGGGLRSISSGNFPNSNKIIFDMRLIRPNVSSNLELNSSYPS